MIQSYALALSGVPGSSSGAEASAGALAAELPWLCPLSMAVEEIAVALDPCSTMEVCRLQ